MARVTVDDCLKHVDNRFELVLIAAKRAHQLNNGNYNTTIDKNNDKPTVIALREIELGLVDRSILDKETASFSILDNDMAEINEELDKTAIDADLDELSTIKDN